MHRATPVSEGLARLLVQRLSRCLLRIPNMSERGPFGQLGGDFCRRTRGDYRRDNQREAVGQMSVHGNLQEISSSATSANARRMAMCDAAPQ